MKITTWNINGLKSSIKNKSLEEYLINYKPDILCIQEIKISSLDDINPIKELLKENDYRYVLHFNRKGYSGVGIIYKSNLNIIKKRKNKNEGRILCFEFDDFILVNVYVPNSGSKLERLNYRINEWDKNFTKFLNELEKPIILCGDMNVANEPIDIARPDTNKKSAGFTQEERDSFKEILNEIKLTDVWRELHPEKIQYTFWSQRMRSSQSMQVSSASQRMGARERNIGWRLDYFLTINIKYKSCEIIDEQMGSDHCPIELIF
jgi:exodeoxyribonuclease III